MSTSIKAGLCWLVLLLLLITRIEAVYIEREPAQSYTFVGVVLLLVMLLHVVVLGFQP